MNKTVLIVDDIPLNIDMLVSILGDEYKTMAAVSGENAIRLFDRKIPDLVLLDVSMPGIDGFGVLKYMREQESLANVPVIFVTGERNEYTEEKGLMLGAVDYIKKPYNASVVRFKVRNHLELKAYRDNLEQLVHERTKQLASSREAIIMGMSLMSEIHDKVTGEHIRRIKLLTQTLAQKLMEVYPDMLPQKLADQIILYSPLHDVGKIGVSDTILTKMGLLTTWEFNIMKTHTLEGAELLRKTETYLTDNGDEDGLSVAIQIAECHHERFDGTGYPYGLKGEQIPLPARIVALADVYDALRSVRPYKKAFSHNESVDIIFFGDKKTHPSHFDPRVLHAFDLVHHSFEQFYT